MVHLSLNIKGGFHVYVMFFLYGNPPGYQWRRRTREPTETTCRLPGAEEPGASWKGKLWNPKVSRATYKYV